MSDTIAFLTREQLAAMLEDAADRGAERALARFLKQSVPTNAPKLLTREEAQERLGIARSAFYELRRRKKIEAVYLGSRQPRYREDDVNRLVEEGVT